LQANVGVREWLHEYLAESHHRRYAIHSTRSDASDHFPDEQAIRRVRFNEVDQRRGVEAKSSDTA
jgi:hypothetical protein